MQTAQHHQHQQYGKLSRKPLGPLILNVGRTEKTAIKTALCELFKENMKQHTVSVITQSCRLATGARNESTCWPGHKSQPEIAFSQYAEQITEHVAIHYAHCPRAYRTELAVSTVMATIPLSRRHARPKTPICDSGRVSQYLLSAILLAYYMRRAVRVKLVRACVTHAHHPCSRVTHTNRHPHMQPRACTCGRGMLICIIDMHRNFMR